jgi:hypothetical protein
MAWVGLFYFNGIDSFCADSGAPPDRAKGAEKGASKRQKRAKFGPKTAKMRPQNGKKGPQNGKKGPQNDAFWGPPRLPVRLIWRETDSKAAFWGQITTFGSVLVPKFRSSFT